MAEYDMADFTVEDNDVVNDVGLTVQDLSKLDVSKIAADTLEVMSRQATINVGTIGHVAHGKSTVVGALSGVRTQKYHREAVMNITIHLGYANAKIFQCSQCPAPTCFQTYPSSQPDDSPCPNCGTVMTLRRHFSFVDCPGHDVLMATMINGASIMDAALLLIAANESFPQPQTIEHLAAAEMMCVRHLIVLQNKVDLVSSGVAQTQYAAIRRYLSQTAYSDAPILPISAQRRLNMDFLAHYLVHVPLPTRRPLHTQPAQLHVLRSFDLSHPGPLESGDEGGKMKDGKRGGLRGGVVGGTLEHGIMCVGDCVELLPGLLCVSRRDGTIPTRQSLVSREDLTYFSSPPPGQLHCAPIRSTVASLRAERHELPYAIPGGLIAVGTLLDPAMTRQDKLRGQVLRVCHSQVSSCSSSRDDVDESESIQVFSEIDIQFFLLRELLGHASTSRRYQRALGDAEGSGARMHKRRAGHGGVAGGTGAGPGGGGGGSTHVPSLLVGESLVINAGTMATAATVLQTSKHFGRAICALESPLCACAGDRVVIARYVDRKVRLIGWGTIKRGVPVHRIA